MPIPSSGIAPARRPITRQRTRTGSSGEGGYVVASFALMSGLLFGMAGLALDGSHDRGVQLQAQYASDAASISAAKVWKTEAQTTNATGPPAYAPGNSDQVVPTAQAVAGLDGFATGAANVCVVSSGAQLTVDFYDVPVTACPAAPSAWRNTVEVSSPPLSPTTSDQCDPSIPWECIQVTATKIVPNYLFGILGVPTSTVRATSIAQAGIARNAPSLPGSWAVQATRPQGIYDPTKPFVRTLANEVCQNCPAITTTGTASQGLATQVFGYNWNLACGGCDQGVATSSAAVVLQGGAYAADGSTARDNRLELCDSSGGVGGCSSGTGTTGLAMTASGTDARFCGSPAITCSAVGAAAAPALGLLQQGSSTSYPTGAGAPGTWTPNVSATAVTALPDCGVLVLDGDPLVALAGKPAVWGQHGTSALSDTRCVNSAQPYTIQPGRYQGIAINHGAYNFGPGLFDIYGNAPTSSSNNTTALASGIDHSQESTADFDLCTSSNQPCAGAGNGPRLTAGVWIGHGSTVTSGGATNYVAGSAENQVACSSSTVSSVPGGGDQTSVMGRDVSFRFEALAGGFVSTHEVTNVFFSAPPVGSASSVGYAPLLFDDENPNGWIHLDGPGNTGAADNANGFRGIVYVVHNPDPGTQTCVGCTDTSPTCTSYCDGGANCTSYCSNINQNSSCTSYCFQGTIGGNLSRCVTYCNGNNLTRCVSYCYDVPPSGAPGAGGNADSCTQSCNAQNLRSCVDVPAGNCSWSGFTGNPVGGGVEINPGMADTKQPLTPDTTAYGQHAAVYGQVIGDTVIFFGSPGAAVDFSNGWGAVLLPDRSPNATRRDAALLQQLVVSGNSTTTTVQLVWQSPTALDGYTSSVTVNATQAWPSKAFWGGSSSQPPATGNPSDGSPRDPSAAADAAYVSTFDHDGMINETYSPSAGTTLGLDGDWVWGHQTTIPVNPPSAPNGSTIHFGGTGVMTYSFPTITGQPTLTISWDLVDGSGPSGGTTANCGNSYGATITVNNIGYANAGQTTREPASVVG